MKIEDPNPVDVDLKTVQATATKINQAKALEAEYDGKTPQPDDPYAKVAEDLQLLDEPAEVGEAFAGPAGASQPLSPLLQAFMMMGKVLGRDLGIIALRALEQQRGGIGATLFYEGEAKKTVDVQVDGKAPEDIDWIRLVPPGGDYPSWMSRLASSFSATQGQTCDETIVIAGRWKKNDNKKA